ncbi:MAG: arsenate reductase (thioredoxin) [Sulfuricaulis sp.]
MYKRKARILFLCTGNSCRSQMAQGWANDLGREWLEARSAGIEAHGQNPRAVAVMREARVDISQQESTRVTPEMLEWADLVVTVCGHADEHCPALPPGVQKKHWPLKDPARARGTDAEIMQVFRTTRDEIRNRVEGMIGGIKLLARQDANISTGSGDQS